MTVRQAGQIRQFICDSEADLASIANPGVGSFAVCEAEDSQWFYGASGWTQASSAGGLPSWFQSGSSSPVGVVTPTQKGALYQDTTNGALYVAIGVTNADWFGVGLNLNAGDIPGIYSDDFVADKLQVVGAGVGLQLQADHLGQVYVVLQNGVANPFVFVASSSVFTFRDDGAIGLPHSHLYSDTDTPSNALGSNGDWAVTANGKLCFKTGGAWVVVVSEAPGFRALTTPPVSTTVYQNTTGFDLTASLRAVLAVNPVLASDCKVEISPDNFGSAQVWADPALAAGALAVANAPEYIEFPIPANWYYKVTATNTTIGALVAIG